MTYKMNVTIKDPQTPKGMYSGLQFSFTCYFTHNPDTYGNGYYVNIVPDQKKNLVHYTLTCDMTKHLTVRTR